MPQSATAPRWNNKGSQCRTPIGTAALSTHFRSLIAFCRLSEVSHSFI